MPDETVWRTMLFDFYGDLLTDKQREYYDLHYNQDLSLAEIAASSGISRQGVWDNIRRADAALRDTEARLGLVRRFAAQRAAAAALEDTLTKLRDTRRRRRPAPGRAGAAAASGSERIDTMAFESLSDKLTEAFKRLRGKGRLTEADVKEAMREVKPRAARGGRELQGRQGLCAQSDRARRRARMCSRASRPRRWSSRSSTKSSPPSWAARTRS